MPIYDNGPVTIQNKEAGSSFPLLVIPGGWLNSIITALANHAFKPLQRFSDAYRVVALDLRNANGGQHLPPERKRLEDRSRSEPHSRLHCDKRPRGPADVAE